MDPRMQRLDPPVEALGEAGELLDRGHRHAACAIRAAVDPVETMDDPGGDQRLASSSSRSLSYTESRARLIGRRVLTHGHLSSIDEGTQAFDALHVTPRWSTHLRQSCALRIPDSLPDPHVSAGRR